MGVDLTDVGMNRAELGLSFPPFSDEKDQAFTGYHMKQLGVSHLRVAEDWRWREPQQGEFKWKSLDRRLEFCKDRDLELFLTLRHFTILILIPSLQS